MGCKLCVATLVAFLVINVHASDPDITSDFHVPNGTSAVDANSFTFTGLRRTLWRAPNGASFSGTRASQKEFPILNGLGISYASQAFGPGGLNPLHTHPRSSELVLLLQGRLEVGFVDSNNKLFKKVLDTGDMFVIPKGLVHFARNRDSRYPAIAISAFASANPGTVPLSYALFGSGIDADLLAESFGTDIKTIKKMQLN